MNLLFKYDPSGLTAMNETSLKRFLSKGNDAVFIVEGVEGELYVIDDPILILEFESIRDIFSESQAIELMRKKVNPSKYGN